MNKSDKAASYDPDRLLQILEKLAANRSPYFAWDAIRACNRHKISFPDWLTAYLNRCADRMCAERMQSERLAGDERQTWRWIFEFPKQKPGPGGMFEQDRALLKELQKAAFAMNFALRLYDGQDSAEARAEAANGCFGADEPDDRTLQRYLEEFQLDHLVDRLEAFQLEPMTYEEFSEQFLPLVKKAADPFI